jgi:hypothetical protein
MRCELCNQEIAKGANWVQVTYDGVALVAHYLCFFTRMGRAGSGEQAQAVR